MFFKLFKNLIWRDIIKNPIVYLISVTGIALGVAIILAIDLTSTQAKSEFSNNVSKIINTSQLEITDRSFHPFNQDIIKDLEWLYDFNAKLTATVEYYGLIKDKDIISSCKILGLDFTKNHKKNLIEFNPNNYSNDKNNLLDINNCLISQSLAKRLNLKQNSKLKIIIRGKTKFLNIVDILGEDTKEDLVVQDIACAQYNFSNANLINKIFINTDKENIKIISEKLETQLPANLIVEDNGQLIKQSNYMLSSFNSNLHSLGFISLLVGLFLMYNTMTNAIIRQRSNIAILRILGINKLAIAKLFYLEAFILAILGSILGLGIGVLLSGTLLGLVGKTLEHFYFQESQNFISINYNYFLKSFALGLFSSLMVSVIPISETFTITPAVAVKTSSFELRVLKNNYILGLIGLIFIIVTAIINPVAQASNLSTWGYSEALFLILGFILIIPFISNLITSNFFVKLYQLIGGIEAKLAAKILKGTSYRSSIAIAAIMTTLALVVSLNIMISSFRNTVILWMNQSLKADLFLEPIIHHVKNNEFSDTLIDKLKRVDGIKAIDGFISTPIIIDNKIANLAGADLDVLKDNGQLVFLNNQNFNQVMQNLKNDTAIVSECFAKKFKVKQLDFITIPTPNGIKKFKIIGVYYDYSSDLGYIVIQRKDYINYFNSHNITSMAIYLKEKANINSIKSSIGTILLSYPTLELATNKDLKSAALKIFDRTFNVTYLLNAIATIVAMFTVANVLYALLIESSFEYTLLYSIGLSLKQLSKLIFNKVILMGIIGSILGIILGYLLALILIYIINDKSFGWTILLTIPVEKIINSFLLISFMVMLTTILPVKLLNKKITVNILNRE